MRLIKYYYYKQIVCLKKIIKRQLKIWKIIALIGENIKIYYGKYK